MSDTADGRSVDSTAERYTVAAGDELPCSGCGAPVPGSEQAYTLEIRGLVYGFHPACYRAWVGRRA